MRIALIGSEFAMENIHSFINAENQFVNVVDYVCCLEKIPETVDQIQGDFDGLLFTGPLYFLCACHCTIQRIPWAYPKRSTNSVLCALMKAYMSGVDIGKITYDLYDMPSGRYAELLKTHFGFASENICINQFNETPEYQEYLLGIKTAAYYTDNVSEFHMNNCHNGRATFCLTGSYTVAERMMKEGVNTAFVYMTEEDVNRALNELRLHIQSCERQRDNGFAAAVITLSVEMEPELRNGIQEYRQLQSIHRMENDVFAFAQRISAAVERRSGTEYYLYSTKSDIFSVTEQLTEFDLSFRIQYSSDVKNVYVGIGFGQNYCVAKSNALTARRSAEQRCFTCYYIMDESGVPAGPFVLRHHEGQKAVSEIQIEHIAGETGIAPSVINEIVLAMAQFGLRVVTSEQLAKMCGLSVRNMNRVISKLEHYNYAEIVGTRPNEGAGRPKRLIRLKLPNTV